MPINKIQFMSKSDFLDLTPNNLTAVISISDPGEQVEIKDGWANVLQMEFVDGSYNEKIIHQFGDSFKETYGDYFDKMRAFLIKDFINLLLLDFDVTTLIIHCYHGRSRSVAVAMYASDRLNVPLFGDVAEYNHTVYDLLNDPYKFDSLDSTVESSDEVFGKPPKAPFSIMEFISKIFWSSINASSKIRDFKQNKNR